MQYCVCDKCGAKANISYILTSNWYTTTQYHYWCPCCGHIGITNDIYEDNESPVPNLDSSSEPWISPSITVNGAIGSYEHANTSSSKENNKPMNRIEEFCRLVNDMADLYEKKNQNYGNSFGKLYQDLGPVAGLVPLHNKLDRLTYLITHSDDDNHYESIEDTLMDLANYAVMNLVERHMQKSEASSVTSNGMIGKDNGRS